MPNKIQIKRGNIADIPILDSGEFGFTIDSEEVYIGTGSSNIRILTSDDIYTNSNVDSHLSGSNGINYSEGVISPTYGSASNTICQGNDSRLSDARTPTSHDNTYHSTNYAAASLTLTASTGLTGGGDLTTNRSFSVSYGTTSGTACQGNDSRLGDARTPTSHTHGNITNDGLVGSTANLPLITGTGGIVQASSFGTVVNTFCQGNDSRLSNSRQCNNSFDSASTSRTNLGLGSLATISTNASTSNYLRGDGTWATPPDTNTTYSEISEVEITTGTATTLRTLTGRRAKFIADRNVGTATPQAHGSAAVGTSLLYARQDHVHPSDNTNTTYSAGSGISLSGTTFSVAGGNGLTQDASGLSVTSHAGTAGSIGTLNVASGTLGVNLGTTSTTACAGNDSRLSDARTPTSHTHGNITNDGKIGSTTNLLIETTTSGVLTTKSAGTSSQFLRGDNTWSDIIDGGEIT